MGYRRKKGQGLSLNVVVIAALAMLVLVILTVIVIQGGGRVQESLRCEAQPGGQCMQTCGPTQVRSTQYTCPADALGNAQQCCLPLGGDDGPGGPASAFN